jgi:hypothetical protein
MMKSLLALLIGLSTLTTSLSSLYAQERQRLVDVSLATGLPDLAGLCLEIHPLRGTNISLEGCVGTIIFLSSLSGNIKYRFDLIGNSGEKGSELTFGPGVGVRGLASIFPLDSGVGADGMLSLEYVYWFSRHFGLTSQLNAGVSYYWFESNQTSNGFKPLANLSFGLAF